MEESLNTEIKNIMDKAKLLAVRNRIVFNEKIARGKIGYNIIKIAHGKVDLHDSDGLTWKKLDKRDVL